MHNRNRGRGGVSGWLVYTRHALGAARSRAVYQNWHHHASSLGYLMQFRPPPARFLSIGCNLGLFDALLQSHGYEVKDYLKFRVENDRRWFAFGESVPSLDHISTSYFRSRSLSTLTTISMQSGR